ncbi:MAG: ChrR family anti-sigma-E factor [Paracoccaceae bacterium]
MMETIKHHVSDDLLMAYATGNLAEGFSIAVATHVSICDHCRSTLESLNALGGALMEQDTNITVADCAFSKTLERINACQSVSQPEEKLKSDFPEPLSDYVGHSLVDIKWQPLGMGVKQAVLETSEDATARLLYIPAGAEMPDHSHRGLELTLVLEGAFADENDYFAKGDVEIADGSTNHTPVAMDGKPCICLAVTEAPLKFRKMFHRLIQPLIRI